MLVPLQRDRSRIALPCGKEGIPTFCVLDQRIRGTEFVLFDEKIALLTDIGFNRGNIPLVRVRRLNVTREVWQRRRN